MAKNSNVKKTINYRRCVLPSSVTQDLQQLLSAALKAIPKPGDRLEPMNTESTELRCIGSSSVINGCLCGYITSFERGAAQPVVSDDPNATKLSLSALMPPTAKIGSAQQQYVPGVLYFAIYKNHLSFVSTHSIRSSALEGHLSWLLKSKTSLLPATTAFLLSDEALKATKEKIRKSHVKAISFNQPLMTEVERVNDVTLSSAGENKKKHTQSQFKPEGAMFNYLKSMFDDEEQFEKLGLNEVFDGNLEVWVEIRYPKRKRTKPEDAIKLMDMLGIALRDIEGDSVALELENGNKITGQELKISSPITVVLQTNKLPDEKALLQEMVSWLKAQISNGVIDP